MNLQLIENIANSKKIRDRIPKRIKYKDKRNYLELVIKNHVLELQNIELEINLQIQEKTIMDLKNIIESQKKIIQDNNLESQKGVANNNEDNQNLLSNNSFDDIDMDFEDMMLDELGDDGNNLDQEDEEDISDINMLKDMGNEKQQPATTTNNQPVLPSGGNPPNASSASNNINLNNVSTDNKRPSKNDMLPEITHKQRDKSAISKFTVSKTNQDKADTSLNQYTRDNQQNLSQDQQQQYSYIEYEDDGNVTPKYVKNDNYNNPKKKDNFDMYRKKKDKPKKP